MFVVSSGHEGALGDLGLAPASGGDGLLVGDITSNSIIQLCACGVTDDKLPRSSDGEDKNASTDKSTVYSALGTTVIDILKTMFQQLGLRPHLSFRLLFNTSLGHQQENATPTVEPQPSFVISFKLPVKAGNKRKSIAIKSVEVNNGTQALLCIASMIILSFKRYSILTPGDLHLLIVTFVYDT
ncbi:unnamed protein product [Sphagnum jensenii]|uniref:Uncharacterized protein n=1 Tax=Sphagnum jensenii TaxID=128206 RepID=A0ABP0VJL3_9BRYO